ncbi:MAG TPA: hypothetical protein PLC53_01120 [Bacilli bacterium]|nr:hypothetical protein [Bacilli bacterium]
MTIYIAHLYYDLMNLYGEIGNVMVLERLLKDQGIKVIIDKLTVNDKIDFNKYDLIYIGAGTEDNQLIVLRDIIKYKNKIKEYIEKNKFFISTGNSYELFGKSIYNNGKHSGIGIFDYNVKQNDKRLVGDTIVKCKFINENIIGFQNQIGVINDNNNPMFEVLRGIGSYKNSKNEGINYKNFYGTYLLGPILARNPKLSKYIISELIRLKDIKFKLKKFDLNIEQRAHDFYIETYHSEM